MLKFGTFVTKHKKLILIISLLLLVPAIIGMKLTRVNYDILVYLPDNIETVQGEKILQNDFNMGSYSIIVLDNMKTKDIAKLEEKVKKLNNVEKVVSITDIVGTSVPVEMLPSEVTDTLYKDGSTVLLVTFKNAISSDETLQSIKDLRSITDSQCKISGMSATVLDTKELSDSEVSIYVLIAVALCLIILQLALDSYFAPFLILINIGIAILYNMGSNIMLGEISYITKAISAVLQLGVTMDFAIFLYHSYKANKEKYPDNDEAMANAIAKTFVAVLGSSLTTIAGFLALCSMNLTLGKDIGIVMAKGVLIGVICAVTVLPALLLQFDKVVEKTHHKEILPKFKKLKDFNIKHHIEIIIVFLILAPFAIYGNNNTKIYYNLDKSLPESLSSVAANHEVQNKFKVVSTEMVLVNKDVSDEKINEMVNKINNLEGIEWTLSYSKIEKYVPKEAVPKTLLSIFESDKYKIIIINSNYKIASNELNNQITEVNNIIKQYDSNAILAGEGPLTNDLIKISDHDFNSVNAVSIVVIFIIMILVLKSATLPIILITVIEFAIFINMGCATYMNTTLPFVASIVIGTIQLEATIDYGILITTKYITLRKEGKNKHEAIDEALGTSINSILVSGLCFFGATFGVGVYSKIEIISSLCTLMARGAIVSVFVVISLLPALLIAFDKVICKTTAGMRKIKN